MITGEERKFLVETGAKFAVSTLKLCAGNAPGPFHPHFVFERFRYAYMQIMLAWAYSTGDPCKIHEDDLYEITGDAYDAALDKMIKEGVYDTNGTPLH